MMRSVLSVVRSNKVSALLLGALLCLSPGCSLRRTAVHQVGNALAASGTSFSADDDPELIRAAAPFSLKLMESILAEDPNHAALRSAAASGFTQYAYAFVQQDADELEDKDLAAADALRQRAQRLYFRARNHGLRGLETRHGRFEEKLRADPAGTVALARKDDVPLLYWTAASWAAAISLGKDRPELIGEMPFVDALIDRALALDESYGDGAIHAFLVTYEMSRPKGGDPTQRSRQHFDRAVELSHGQQAGPMVAFAEAVSIQKQDLKEFEALLHRALAIPVDARPEWRLANLIMQRRAQWLLNRTDQLFLRPDSGNK